MIVGLVSYDGAYPNACSGKLVVYVAGTDWVFPDYCLRSTGCVWFDDDWCEHVESGPMVVEDWPEGFPEKAKQAVQELVAREICHGCCGGCV